jgi:hypothetical protein
MKYTFRRSGIGKNKQTRKVRGGHYLHRINDPFSKKPYKKAIKPFLESIERLRKTSVHQYIVSKDSNERKHIKSRINDAFTKMFHKIADSSNKSLDKEFWYDINHQIKDIKTDIRNELFQNDAKVKSEELKKAEERRRNNNFLLDIFQPQPVIPAPSQEVDTALVQEARDLNMEVINARSGQWPTENYQELINGWRERLMDIYDSDMPHDENNQLNENSQRFVAFLGSIDNNINAMQLNAVSTRRRGGKRKTNSTRKRS